ncbi:glycosyltransferase family 29 protein, partial [Amylibacter sp.]|nr:glycosyltransferase family 29 protein [Amylibacter sp.]
MNRLSYSIKRAVIGDPFLRGLSADQSTLLDELAGKTVGVIGNARSLSKQAHGAAIDACEIVIRMHAAPLPQPKSHGTKTTWLALGMPVDQTIITDRAPTRLLWMAKKRKRL